LSMDDSQVYAMTQPRYVGEFESSTSIVKLGQEGIQKSQVAPQVKLKAILEITQALARELEIEAVLPKVLQTLCNIFPQAEQGVVLLKEAETERLRVKASRTRGGGEAESVAVSMTVVRHAMQTKESIHSRNVSDDSRFKRSHT